MARTGKKALKLPNDGTVEQLYSEGFSCKKIAERFDCDDEAVRMFLKHRGIERRSRTDRNTVEHQSQRTRIPIDDVVRLYQEGKSTTEIGGLFGVSGSAIVNRLHAANVERRRSFFGSETPFRCEDGHLVRSRYEQSVDDWLWRHDLAHAYEPLLPFPPTQYADFLVRGTYIEVWGIEQSDWYSARKHEKLMRYESAGLPIVSIDGEEALDNLDQLLASLLK